jgi:RNA polymerase sigma factor (sigma-70 family)
MTHVATPSLFRHLGSLFDGGSAAGLSDRQLLERFATWGGERGEAAFATIVARHGPMVLGVCRQLLGDHHHAEDAFQAVFLVLARQARSIRKPDLLGAWLYGVALRTARKARFRLNRRQRTEEEAAGRQLDGSCEPAPEDVILNREQAEALHGEIDRLPEAFRQAIVFCYFEGLSPDEAAERLRWPSGTLRSRLVRGRDRLRRGLLRRGFALSTTALAAALASRPARAAVPSALCDSTTRAAMTFAARHGAAGATVSASAAAIASDVVRAMFLHTLKAASVCLLLLSALVAGSGYLARMFAVGDKPQAPPANRPAPPALTELPEAHEHSTPGRMTVVGRILDPQGKPIPDARVAVLADRMRQVSDLGDSHRNILMGTAAVDVEGRFALEFPTIPAGRLEHLSVIAAAPGRGLKVADLDLAAERQEASLALAAEHPAQGRLIDVQGQPAAGLVVRVGKLRFKHELGPYDAKGAPSVWPEPVTTGADGSFRMRGLGANSPAIFEVDDPRYAHQSFTLDSVRDGNGRLPPGATYTLHPAQTFDLHVTHADDAKAVPGARVSVRAMAENSLPIDEIALARTDAQGRVRIVGWPATEHQIEVHLPEDEPYLPNWRDVTWPKAAVQQSVDFKLRRGVVVRGRVVEGADCVPVAGAWLVYYQTRRNNPRKLDLPSMEAVSDRDGRYTIVVPHGPGHILVQGPSADYLHLSTSASEMGIGLRPSFRLYPDAHQELDLKDGVASYPLDLKLVRGVTITGRVITPDGKPAAEAFIFARSYTPYREHNFPLVGFNGKPPLIPVKAGKFEIPGCDPDNPDAYYFLDVADRLGANVWLSGKSGEKGPVTVQLERTATARFRTKDRSGRPVANHVYADWPELKLIITHGPDFGDSSTNIDMTPGDFAYQYDLDPAANRGIRSGPDGYVTMINLIPGAGYRFRGRDFTPTPGQTIALDDVVVEAESK